MPRSKTTVMVRPEIMKWAIDNSGWDDDKLAQKLNVTDDLIKQWKTKNQGIEIKKLERLSKQIEHPLALFFLKNPPQVLQLTDYRKLPHQITIKLTPKSVLHIRRALYLQSIAYELMTLQKINVVPNTGAKITIQNNPEQIAKKERKKLGLESSDISRHRITKNHPRDFFNMLKETIESLNIFVFQVGIQVDEMSGMALTDKLPQVIIINSKDNIHAKIFSLLHEYGHVLLGKNGMCVPQTTYEHNSSNNYNQRTEKWCNRFAASVLMPAQQFITEYDNIAKSEKNAEKIIDKLSKNFHASKQATLIRLYDLIPQAPVSSKFQALLKKLNSIDNIKKPSRSHGGPGTTTLRISQYGKKFISLVLESKKDMIITNSDVLDYLDITPKYLKKLQEKTLDFMHNH